MTQQWDQEFDFVVIGSGAAGLAGAIRAHDAGAKVVILEKSYQYGGSTAMSGGICWVPDNPDLKKFGIPDSRADALTYLKHITQGEVPDDRLAAYVDGSKRMLDWFQQHTHFRYDAVPRYTDYYAEAPGGKPGGRSMEARPFDGMKLGDDFRALRRPHQQSQILGLFGITAAQAQTLLIASWKSKLFLMWCFLLYSLRWMGRKKYGRDTRLTTGNAVIARLRLSAKERGIPLWLNTSATSLVRDEGRVTGVVAQRDGKEIRIRANKGVLMASGGFERNLEMRRQYQRHPIETTWTAANLHNMGDGIRMGIEAGADLGVMQEAWWTPTTLVPKSELGWVLVVEKSLPGSIFVNGLGKRFTNEAAPYVDVVVEMYKDQAVTGKTIPCHMVFDATFRKNYPVGPVAPGYAMPDAAARKYLNTFLIRADTIGELAAKIGVAPAALTQTVEKFNKQAIAGKDDDFKRGEFLSDRYYGDPRVTPNPCLAPLVKPPFYAIKVYAGDLGTKGGLKVDAASRVLNKQGEPIAGLYAAGNCSASVMGRTYPGAGGTIGPALTFGMIAAETACGKS